MIFASDLIAGFAVASGIGSPDGSERSIFMPHVLNPVVELPKFLPRGTINSVDPQRQSFRVNSTNGRPASAVQIAVTIVTLGRGLWELEVGAEFVASFTQVFDGSVIPAFQFRSIDPTLGTVVHLAAFAVNNVPQQMRRRFRMLLLDDNWSLDVLFAATGVGQTMLATTSIVGVLLT